MPQVMNGQDIQRAVRRIAHEILERHRGAESVVIIGIHTRGVHLARLLGELIAEFEGVEVPVGELDIADYRDDRGLRPLHGAAVTQIPADISDRSVVVVDDVLYTGRTVRAALDALSDLGRARQTELAVLVDRGHRQLPIRADYVGKNLPTSHDEMVRVRIPPVDQDEGVWVERNGAA
ncbi:MAG TPA: bifunctional pyr operon transcriptional regulator/uracil phosphoribosyltransferase PyrR [Acidimicrobiia bacterium]|nr:bifunctional pyr operon transcriptional regulator/uracil phosphoribosyltransferase PyrR [Acidimicrobiia bacterium]